MTLESILSLFAIFGRIVKSECIPSDQKTFKLTFENKQCALKAVSSMNGFSVQNTPLKVMMEGEFNLLKNAPKPVLPEAVGYVDYGKKREESCVVLLTGFSEGDDVRNPSNITELKRLATEQGKLKDMKYIEIGKEKRLFLQFANSYSASIAVRGLSGLLFNGSRLTARQYDSARYRVKDYSM
ncbi:hypothetical protein AV274_1622 [Blastocystis sp. ATCC 50177/Nand II]|uniref:RRM domain-containing protein n=1 Tax=Blastocystis sp. subtype 1 (strain ATCC 50177 / NandII) TaxID=478820 RepID=A0A196SI02_BLAHN|nr:hypothetical protein AV274_1622 [Blastocystis sp. ATCC 50177/Nand II]